jgi:hypothetical protein
MTTNVVQTVPHEVRRLAVPLSASYEEAVRRYERLVPVVDDARLQQLASEGASWEAIVELAVQNAPLEFMIYWRADFAPVMALAGDRWQCVAYLMGNHTTAQPMFHHDPAVMLYAPLRTAIYVGSEGGTWFTVDQPSTLFDSFGNPAIAAVGLDVDHKLGRLIEALGGPVPGELRS